MFAQLYIIYIFFLVSAVVGIPVVNLQNQTFSTDSLVPTRPKCTDPNNAKYKSSVCATRKSVRVSCESYNYPGTAIDTNFNCGDGESCVDITSNDAFCVDDNSAQEWGNNQGIFRICSAPVLLAPSQESFQLVAGMTTYSIKGELIKVVFLEVRYDDNDSDDHVKQENNYSLTIKQENFSRQISFCFTTGNPVEVQAVASLAYILM